MNFNKIIDIINRMNHKFNFSFFIFLLFSFLAVEQLFAYQLVLWKPSNYTKDNPSYLLAIPDGANLRESVTLYFSILEDQLKEDFYNQNSIKLDDFKIITNINTSFGSDLIFVLLNENIDMKNENKNISRFKKIMNPMGFNKIYLPIMATVLLNKKEQNQFADFIANNASVLIATGGNDIDPKIYGEKNRKSYNVNPLRDELESQIIRAFILKANGFFLGICRGAQLASVLMGLKLYQDLNTEFENPNLLNHQNGFHDIILKETSNNILKNIYNFNSNDNNLPIVNVNTLHHQSKKWDDLSRGGDHSLLELAAVAEDGVVEALEFKNGKGLLVQYHPEIIYESFEPAFNFFRRLMSYIKTVSPSVHHNFQCSKLFK